MQVLVPFAVDAPKTRLGPTLDAAERRDFALAMLADVVEAIRATGREPTLLATAPLESAGSESALPNLSISLDDRPLSPAVNAVLAAETPVAIVMADLALATPEALERLFATEGEVVMAPGRGGGTNALLVRHPAFRVDYHGASALDHRRIACDVGATLELVDSYRLSTDVDEPVDLVEVLLHGRERSRSFLERAGFVLETTDGRLTVVREAN